MNKENELWNIFMQSGKIDDYLRYRNTVTEAENRNVPEHNGNRNTGKDGKGKRQNYNRID